MTFDTAGVLYVATSIGVQAFDRAGRLIGIIPAPGGEGASDVFFAGPDMSWLYATDGEKVYRRLTVRHGAGTYWRK
jgi:gluconolactonase